MVKGKKCLCNIGYFFFFSLVLFGGLVGFIYIIVDDMNKWMNFNFGNGFISNGSVVILDKYFIEFYKE